MPTALRVVLELLPGRAVVPVGVVGQSYFARWRGLDGETDAAVTTTGPGLRARRPDGSTVTLPGGSISDLGGGAWGADIVLDAAGLWVLEAAVSGPVPAYDQETARCAAGVVAGDAWPVWVAAADSAAAAAASAATASAASAAAVPAASTAAAAAATATSQAAAAAASAALALGSSPALIGRWSQRLIETDGIPIIAGGYAEPYLGAPPSLAPNVSLTRASKGWGFVDGVLTEFAVDTPRWVDWLGSIGVAPGNRARGLLLEGARTNNIRNPRFEGGTVGTASLPTFGAAASTPGLAYTFAARGVQSGLDYMDFATLGTNTVGGQSGYSFEGAGGIAITVPPLGAATLSCFQALASGAFAGTGTVLRATGFTTPAGATNAIANPGASLAFVSGLWLTTPGVASTAPSWRNVLNINTVVNFAVRLLAPQLEVGGFASSPILPTVGTPATASRSRDTLPPLTLAGPAMVLIEALVPALPTTSDGDMVLAQWGATDNDRIRLRIPAGTSNLVAGRVVGGVSTDATVLGTVTAGVGFRALLGHNDGGTLVGCLNGGTAQTLTGAAVAPTALRLGNDIAGAAPLFGVVRQARAYLRYSTAEAVTLTA